MALPVVPTLVLSNEPYANILPTGLSSQPTNSFGHPMGPGQQDYLSSSYADFHWRNLQTDFRPHIDQLTDNRPSNQSTDNRPSNQSTNNRPSHQSTENCPENHPSIQSMDNRPSNQLMDDRPSSPLTDNRPPNQSTDKRPSNQTNSETDGNPSGGSSNNHAPQDLPKDPPKTLTGDGADSPKVGRSQPRMWMMVSLPLFHDETVLLHNKCCEDKKPHLSEAQKFQDKNNWNWITKDLQDEMERHFPVPEDVKKTGKNQGHHSRQSLQSHAESIFPVGQVFASRVQLHQFAEEFAKPWGFTVSHSSGKFICGFSKNGKSRKGGNGKKKVVQKTGKEIHNCPFEIRHGFKDCGIDQFHRNNKTPMVLFPCVITFSNCAHACPCTPSSMQTMMKQTGKSSIDLEGVVHIVKLLRGDPDIPNVSLCPLLQRSLPNHHWNSDAIKNF